MVNEIKLRRAGGSISATLPKAMAEKLHLQAGDPVFAIETDEGILLTPYDPHFGAAMKVYQRGARKYRQALRELAK
ncbi:MAG: AbrB/MazE/SpoVT family DNA-binding domain-containing protein [bacterium]|nr:AbrB/MazE/SpoVT family DNA-binding domain-containing protein [bacterium]